MSGTIEQAFRPSGFGRMEDLAKPAVEAAGNLES